MAELLVVLGFDMETDIGSWTPYYEGLQKGTPRILKVLAKKNLTGTFFFTGEAAKRYRHIVSDVSSAGHEVGCHSLFHETLGDELFPIPGIKPLLPEEVPLRIRRATEYVEEASGSKVVSFRCPRLWGSTAVVNALESLGYLADSSYPLYFYGKRLIPYHPSREDWTREGDLKVLEIPLFADMTVKSKDPYGRDRDQWPLYRTESARKLMIHIESHLKYLKRKKLPAVLCFYFHPWEFIKVPSGRIHYAEGSVIPDKFLIRNCGERALMEFERLLDGLSEMGACFLTARRLAEQWDSRVSGR